MRIENYYNINNNGNSYSTPKSIIDIFEYLGKIQQQKTNISKYNKLHGYTANRRSFHHSSALEKNIFVWVLGKSPIIMLILKFPFKYAFVQILLIFLFCKS